MSLVAAHPLLCWPTSVGLMAAGTYSTIYAPMATIFLGLRVNVMETGCLPAT